MQRVNILHVNNFNFDTFNEISKIGVVGRVGPARRDELRCCCRHSSVQCVFRNLVISSLYVFSRISGGRYS
jgi:hypothetical protein